MRNRTLAHLLPIWAITWLGTTSVPAAVTVPLQITESLGQARHEVVTSGLPLPKGLLKDPAGAGLVDARPQQGEAVSDQGSGRAGDQWRPAAARCRAYVD